MAFLKNKSIEIILNNQHTSGSFAACPNFSQYNFCWLRDGGFIAYSMDLNNQHDISAKYHDWVNNVLLRYKGKVDDVIDMVNRKEPLLNSDYLPARYTQNGLEINDEWPNFQLDGFGIWLWALCEHIKATGNDCLITKYNTSIKLIITYLVNLWNLSCFDCWEENGDRIHTSTLASIYGGLNSISHYIHDDIINETMKEVREYILKNCTNDGRLTKHTHDNKIDASLLWAAVPFKVLDINDEMMINTIREIERQLLHAGGVHRYIEDVYYGGGEWLILSCWLGWYYAETGETNKAIDVLRWVETHATPDGELPEQSLEHVNNPEYIDRWKELWGQVASPSLWAHAMYLVLVNKLGI